MSAFLLPPEALSNLAFEFVRLGERCYDFKPLPRNRGFVNAPGQSRLEQVFQVLLAQNLRSLRHRYYDRIECQRRCYGGWRAIEPAAGYKELPVDLANLVQLCDCFDYQSCEAPGYRHSLAAHIIEATRHAAFRAWLEQNEDPRSWGGPLKGYIQ